MEGSPKKAKGAASEKEARRGRPAKVTRDQLAAAVSIFGFQEVKLSDVATHLGIALQTLYNHVKDREELLNLAAEAFEAGRRMPSAGNRSWEDWWRIWAYVLYESYRRSPGLATILASRPLAHAPPLKRLDQWEIWQTLAERSGFTPLEGMWANLAVSEFVISWAARAEQPAKRPPNEVDKPLTKEELAALAPRVANATESAEGRPIDERFSFLLDALLAGLLAKRSNPPPETADDLR